MRIEIKYESSEGGHLIDLDLSELNQLRNNGTDAGVCVRQNRTAAKVLYITGSADELELMASALLNKAINLRHPIA